MVLIFLFFNPFITLLSLCTGCLKVYGQLVENTAGTVTECSNGEGKSVNPAAAGSDTMRGRTGYGLGKCPAKGMGV